MSSRHSHRMDRQRRALLGGLGLLSAGGLGMAQATLASQEGAGAARHPAPQRTPAAQRLLDEDPVFGNAPGYAAPMGFGRVGTAYGEEGLASTLDLQFSQG